jgi:hypothetical protein
VLRSHIAARDREERFGGPGFSVKKANAIVDQAIKAGQFIVIMTHAVAEAGYQPVSQEELEGHLHYVSTLKGLVWVDTLANVARYVRERDSATVQIQRSEADGMTFALTSPLDPAVFNAPLTCVIRAGGLVNSASAHCGQGGVALPAAISGDQVLVDVVPGTGSVTVRWTRTSGPARSTTP